MIRGHSSRVRGPDGSEPFDAAAPLATVCAVKSVELRVYPDCVWANLSLPFIFLFYLPPAYVLCSSIRHTPRPDFPPLI
jgi:hypothetical protein